VKLSTNQIRRCLFEILIILYKKIKYKDKFQIKQILKNEIKKKFTFIFIHINNEGDESSLL